MRSALWIPILAVSAYACAQVAEEEMAKATWMPKAGMTAKYKITRTGTHMGEPLRYSTLSEWTVSEVRPNGDVVLKRKNSDVMFQHGKEDWITRWRFTPEGTWVYSPMGELLEWPMDPPVMSPRLEWSYVFMYPSREMKVGETWTKTWPANVDKGMFGRTATYTYDGSEKVGQWDTWRYRVNFSETDAPSNLTTEGYVWVSKDDGSLVRATYTTKNAEWIAGVTPAETTTEFMRVP